MMMWSHSLRFVESLEFLTGRTKYYYSIKKRQVLSVKQGIATAHSPLHTHIPEHVASDNDTGRK